MYMYRLWLYIAVFVMSFFLFLCRFVRINVFIKGKDTRFSGFVGMAILWRFMQVFFVRIAWSGVEIEIPSLRRSCELFQCRPQ